MVTLGLVRSFRADRIVQPMIGLAAGVHHLSGARHGGRRRSRPRTIAARSRRWPRASAGVALALGPRVAVVVEADVLMTWPSVRPSRVDDADRGNLRSSLPVHACGAACDLLGKYRSAGVAPARGARACGCAPNVLVARRSRPCPDGGVVSARPGCAPPSLLDDLVGYWRLDDGTGSTIASDWSGNGNDGTLVDLDPATVWIAGAPRGGLAVEGAGFVNVPPSPSIDSITDQVTIAGWGYLEGTIDDYATDRLARGRHHHRPALSHLDQFARRSAGPLAQDGDGQPRLLQGPTPSRARPGSTSPAPTTGRRPASTSTASRWPARPITGRFVADTTPFILGGNGNGAGRRQRHRTLPGPHRRDHALPARAQRRRRSRSSTTARCSRRRAAAMPDAGAT